jgi:uncharacterized membrane protein YqhA
MASLQDFALPVLKSLQQPDLLLRILKPVIALILCMTMILVYCLFVKGLETKGWKEFVDGEYIDCDGVMQNLIRKASNSFDNFFYYHP